MKDDIGVLNILMLLVKQSCRLKSLILYIDLPTTMSNDIVGNLFSMIFDKEALEKLKNLTIL